MRAALRMRIAGRVQGVGFRPHVYRLATGLALTGWVRNGADGVVLHVEGASAAVEAFARRVTDEAPPAAVVEEVVRLGVVIEEHSAFEIRASDGGAATTALAPDLATCPDCLAELRDPASRFCGYPHLNCTQCGPRYSVATGLPYDRARTTLAAWPMCAACSAEYADPAGRRFHAQPTACPRCGPGVRLEAGTASAARGADAIAEAARRLSAGQIVAVKGIGGYFLACDARDPAALAALRTRKGRREKPFAVMARDLATARRYARIDPVAERLLVSAARPIVLLPVQGEPLPPALAPGRDEIGLMLPYAPVHTLLFDAGAPELIVCTSGNRSSEPIVTDDARALEWLGGLADAVLVGERPIARRVDDSVVRPGPNGPLVVRRARGYAPASVARMPGGTPVLAVGADLKNAPLLVVGGQAFGAPYVGDLSHYEAEEAFVRTVHTLLATYGLGLGDVRIVRDAHPAYRSTLRAQAWAEAAGGEALAVQHHRAHIASVLAERSAWDARVVGLALDGTGWGDDGTVWGGEVLAGSLRGGFERAGHLRPALLVGGDAAARWPVQAAAGFLFDASEAPELSQPPFGFPDRYAAACRAARAGVRTLPTTSAGRLFDAAAALCGFVREQTYEGQAAAWLEALARRAPSARAYDVPDLDGPALLATLARDRAAGADPVRCAHAFHETLALGLARTARRVAAERGCEAVVAGGGVWLNVLLTRLVRAHLDGLPLWLPHRVPVGDGGIALGQAATACVTL